MSLSWNLEKKRKANARRTLTVVGQMGDAYALVREVTMQVDYWEEGISKTAAAYLTASSGNIRIK